MNFKYGQFGGYRRKSPNLTYAAGLRPPSNEELNNAATRNRFNGVRFSATSVFPHINKLAKRMGA